MRNYCIIVVLFWLFCLPIQSAQAQISNALTVEESVKMGLEHSYQLQAAEADAEEANAAFRGIRSGRLPSITGQASYMR
ncbi:MAG TPA: TolC family protein, partial [Fodinibius sp.]|nr:TolC family protein [Fodinibius sp.]